MRPQGRSRRQRGPTGRALSGWPEQGSILRQRNAVANSSLVSIAKHTFAMAALIRIECCMHSNKSPVAMLLGISAEPDCLPDGLGG